MRSISLYSLAFLILSVITMTPCFAANADRSVNKNCVCQSTRCPANCVAYSNQKPPINSTFYRMQNLMGNHG